MKARDVQCISSESRKVQSIRRSATTLSAPDPYVFQQKPDYTLIHAFAELNNPRASWTTPAQSTQSIELPAT